MVLGKLAVTCKICKKICTQYTKINSKWVKDLNIRPETIKFLKENTDSSLLYISLSNIFLDMSPQTRERRAKINYWGYIKLKSFAQ